MVEVTNLCMAGGKTLQAKVHGVGVSQAGNVQRLQEILPSAALQINSPHCNLPDLAEDIKVYPLQLTSQIMNSSR